MYTYTYCFIKHLIKIRSHTLIHAYATEYFTIVIVIINFAIVLRIVLMDHTSTIVALKNCTRERGREREMDIKTRSPEPRGATGRRQSSPTGSRITSFRFRKISCLGDIGRSSARHWTMKRRVNFRDTLNYIIRGTCTRHSKFPDPAWVETSNNSSVCICHHVMIKHYVYADFEDSSLSFL